MTSVSKLLRRSETAVLAILIVVMIVIGVINPAFWQADNLFNLLRANVVIGIMALSVLIVMISGGIDVSFPAFAVAVRARSDARLYALAAGVLEGVIEIEAALAQKA